MIETHSNLLEAEIYHHQFPKRLNSYFDIVDKVVAELQKNNKTINRDRLQKGNLRNGYKKYFIFNRISIGVSYLPELWENHADTPFWISIAEDNGTWEKTAELKTKCEQIALNSNTIFIEKGKEMFLSLKPMLHVTEEIVVKDLSTQIEKIIQEIVK